MFDLNPNLIAILGFLFFAVLALSRSLKIRVYRNSTGTRQIKSPDEAINAIERAKEQIKSANKPGRSVFVYMRDADNINSGASKSADSKINNHEETIKLLDEFEDKIRRLQTSAKSTDIKVENNVQIVSQQKAVPVFTTTTFNVHPKVSIVGLSPLKCFIAAAICIVAGCLMLYVANNERQNALASVTWPATEGRITISYNRMHRGFEWTTQIKYLYTVNGKQYSDDTIAYNSTWMQDHYDAPKRYPVGSSVKVFYSPDNPYRSCLEVGNTNIIGQRFYLATICLAAGILFILMLISPRQNLSANASSLDAEIHQVRSSD